MLSIGKITCYKWGMMLWNIPCKLWEVPSWRISLLYMFYVDWGNRGTQRKLMQAQGEYVNSLLNYPSQFQEYNLGPLRVLISWITAASSTLQFPFISINPSSLIFNFLLLLKTDAFHNNPQESVSTKVYNISSEKSIWKRWWPYCSISFLQYTCRVLGNIWSGPALRKKKSAWKLHDALSWAEPIYSTPSP